jgi:hypothetical protein
MQAETERVQERSGGVLVQVTITDRTRLQVDKILMMPVQRYRRLQSGLRGHCGLIAMRI